MKTDLKFVHVGMGNIVCANRVLCIIRPGTECAKRMLKSAKQSGAYIDACLARPMKSLLLLDDGGVIGSAITTKTLMKRFNGTEDYNMEEIEEDNDESD